MAQALSKLPCPTESVEAQMLVAWLRVRGIAFHHSPNETGSSAEMKRRAGRVKREGTSKGFPDYVIALPHVGIVYIELKRVRGSTVSPEQRAWIDVLNKCPGSAAHIAKGASEAISIIESYLPKSPVNVPALLNQDGQEF